MKGDCKCTDDKYCLNSCTRKGCEYKRMLNKQHGIDKKPEKRQKKQKKETYDHQVVQGQEKGRGLMAEQLQNKLYDICNTYCQDNESCTGCPFDEDGECGYDDSDKTHRDIAMKWEV